MFNIRRIRIITEGIGHDIRKCSHSRPFRVLKIFFLSFIIINAIFLLIRAAELSNRMRRFKNLHDYLNHKPGTEVSLSPEEFNRLSSYLLNRYNIDLNNYLDKESKRNTFLYDEQIFKFHSGKRTLIHNI